MATPFFCILTFQPQIYSSNSLQKILENLYVPRTSQENSEPTFLYYNSSFFWFISETKDDILDSAWVPILKLNREHKDEISAGPKQDSLPQPTTTQPSTFKALQTTIVKVMPPVFPSIVF